MSTKGTGEALRQLGLSSNGLAATHSWVWPTCHSDSLACIMATVVGFLKDKRQYVSTATEPTLKHRSVLWGPASSQIPGACNKTP